MSSVNKFKYNKLIDLLETECGMPYATAHVARVKRDNGRKAIFEGGNWLLAITEQVQYPALLMTKPRSFTSCTSKV
jgi:hypothetical protein